MQEIRIRLWSRTDGWSIEINSLLHEHVSTEAMEGWLKWL